MSRASPREWEMRDNINSSLMWRMFPWKLSRNIFIDLRSRRLHWAIYLYFCMIIKRKEIIWRGYFLYIKPTECFTNVMSQIRYLEMVHDSQECKIYWIVFFVLNQVRQKKKRSVIAQKYYLLLWSFTYYFVVPYSNYSFIDSQSRPLMLPFTLPRLWTL